MSTIEKAISIAAKYHEGQKDKAGEAYIFHLLRVMLQMKDEKEQIVAVLHDILEDTTCKQENLKNSGFSEEIMEAIEVITKIDGEPYENYLLRVKCNPIARLVKLVDLSDNMRIDRLPEITNADLERLKKYKLAVEYLKGG